MSHVHDPILENRFYTEWESIEKIYNKKSLLVCIGDSWTWGDSLSWALERYDNKDHILVNNNWDKHERSKYCYGNIISNHLGSDWINLGWPGGSNHYIVKRFQEALNSDFINQYEDVYYVLCLTETGRELAEPDYDIDLSGDSDEILQRSEQHLIDTIMDIYNGDMSKLVICRNFTKSYENTSYHTKHLKSWVRVNFEKERPSENSDSIMMSGPATGIGYNTLDIKNIESKESYVTRRYDEIDRLYTFLQKSKYHKNKATKHPTRQSHELWANYIYEWIKNGKS